MFNDNQIIKQKSWFVFNEPVDITHSYQKYKGFPCGSEVKDSPTNTGDTGLNPALEDPLEEEMATHTDILGLKILMDRGP